MDVMNGRARTERNTSAAGLRKLLSLALVPVAIAACSSDNGVSLGDGQTADPVVIDFPIAYVRSPIPLDEDGELIKTQTFK